MPFWGSCHATLHALLPLSQLPLQHCSSGYCLFVPISTIACEMRHAFLQIENCHLCCVSSLQSLAVQTEALNGSSCQFDAGFILQ